jgi:hypothetical protein
MNPDIFSQQLQTAGIDQDRSKVIGEMLAREAIDANAINDRTDAEKELVANVVDEIGCEFANLKWGDRVQDEIVDRFEKERTGDFYEPPKRKSSGRPSKQNR